MSVVELRPCRLAHPKLAHHHLQRRAVVYVRQSSLRQVEHNKESTRLQYGLRRRAQALGWHPDRVEVIDDDLGVSGASVAGRHGFQRLLGEIAMDHVGLVLGIEMSRLARSNRDWHQLLELCARFGTLIADADGVYDPTAYNDRLLLGLKGTMSEAELHILRQRLQEGKMNKARRGELGKRLPGGYFRRPSGEVVLDPDDGVRESIAFVFDSFERIGTLHGLLRFLVERDVRIGGRVHTGATVGDVAWRRPHRGLLSDMLRNPIYAGAYVYGRRQTDPRKKIPGRPASGRTGLVPMDEWKVCRQNQHPAYISWEQFRRNQEQLDKNRQRAESPGTPRNGATLLQGIVVCGRCGRRMQTAHSTKQDGRTHCRYACLYDLAHFAGPRCQSLSAGVVDECIGELVIEALAPAALELSLRAADDLERQRQREDDLWKKRVERDRYAAELAARQYRAVDPENRLVARTLERDWEAALRKAANTTEEYERHQRCQPRLLTQAERDKIASLARQVPELWLADSTTPADRKAILRVLLEKVVLTVEGETEWVEVVIHWAGGHQTRRRIRRPVAKLSQLSGYNELVARMKELRRAGEGAREIANALNSEGWVTPTRRGLFNERLVRAMMARHGVLDVPKGRKPPPSPNEWWLADLAKELDVPRPTLYGWLRRGLLRARRVEEQGRAWAVFADDPELQRLHELRVLHRQRRQGPPEAPSVGEAKE